MNILKKTEHLFKALQKKRKRARISLQSVPLVLAIKSALSRCPDPIPVVIICYNNGIYVKNMVSQLRSFNLTPIVIDNASTAHETQDILRGLETSDEAVIARSPLNFGHMVGFIEPVYGLWPEVFAITDPDLQLHRNLPADFLLQLEKLCRNYNVYKAGFALSLEGHGTFIDIKYPFKNESPVHFEKKFGIQDWESQFWRFRLANDAYEVYAAPIDTTFAVYVKSLYRGHFTEALRVAGNFSTIHLPWFSEQDLFSNSAKAEYKKSNSSTSWV